MAGDGFTAVINVVIDQNVRIPSGHAVSKTVLGIKVAETSLYGEGHIFFKQSHNHNLSSTYCISLSICLQGTIIKCNDHNCIAYRLTVGFTEIESSLWGVFHRPPLLIQSLQCEIHQSAESMS